MSFDWTKEELLREIKEREEAGEPKEVTFDFIWAVVERAYRERDQFVGATEAERAAVVAWLYRDGCEASAERVERGEHRRDAGTLRAWLGVSP